MDFKRSIGMLVACVFSFTYVITPLYLISSVVLLAMYPTVNSLIFMAPIIISALIPVIQMPGIVKSTIFGYMKDYFDYEEHFEMSDDKLIELIDSYKKAGRSIIFTGLPHGIVSYGGLCAGAAADPRYNKLVTAAAGAVLATPILKHIVGVFGLIDASGKSLKKRLAKSGMEGSVVLYTGGIAELFKCSTEKEILFLKQRKGFIKLALREGADIVPLYFFGNTSVLTIPVSSLLETISRKLQVSLTIFWGRWGLPIPRPHKILYVRGAPLNLPVIKEPTDEEVDKYHAKYVAEIVRIFEKYKGRLPEYKNKELVIE